MSDKPKSITQTRKNVRNTKRILAVGNVRDHLLTIATEWTQSVKPI